MLGLAAQVHAYTPLNAILSVDNPEGNMGGARVRVVHLSPDAPAVDVWVNDSKVFPNVAFEDITDFVEVPAGSYNVQVVPAGATEPVVIGGDFDLMAATDYTVVATGFLTSISPVIMTADGGTPAEGKASGSIPPRISRRACGGHRGGRRWTGAVFECFLPGVFHLPAGRCRDV